MNRLAVFAHWAPTQVVGRHTLVFLQHVVNLGFEITFVSNSRIDEESTSRIEEICLRLVIRENQGLDFSMWRAGLLLHDLNQFQEVLLFNSSVFGPFHPLDELWKRAARMKCDYWGITDSEEIGRHIQSYFMVFRSSLIHSSCFTDFWSGVLPYRTKDQIIRSYEVGLSVWLKDNGFEGKAVFPSDALLLDFQRLCDGRPIREKIKSRLSRLGPSKIPVSRENASLTFPKLLMEQGNPLVKMSLFPEGVELDGTYFGRQILEASVEPDPAKMLLLGFDGKERIGS